MNINGIESSIFQKLFNRCAMLSIMEDAKQTHDAILAASELTRYFFDSRETVKLSEESEKATLYITHFIANPGGKEYVIQLCDQVLYIKRMSALSCIISETQREIPAEKGTKIEFIFSAENGLKLTTQVSGSILYTLDLPTY